MKHLGNIIKIVQKLAPNVVVQDNRQNLSSVRTNPIANNSQTVFFYYQLLNLRLIFQYNFCEQTCVYICCIPMNVFDNCTTT